MSGFGDVLRAEWTKFRTVRGWTIGLIVGVILMAFLGVFLAGSASIGCVQGNVQKSGRACLPYIPIGPGGEAVQDNFYFVRQPLTGDGSITARLTSLVSRSAAPGGPNSGRVRAHPVGGPGLPQGAKVLVPWAKGGIMIKASLKQGSAYAAMLVTGSHGVRLQYDYTGDIAGLPGKVSAGSPRWLRLRRNGETITGYDSVNGTDWTKVGTVTLPSLPRTVQVGLFATSPQHLTVSAFFGGESIQGGTTAATAVLDHVRLSGATGPGSWTGHDFGGGPSALVAAYQESAGTFTLTGSGDIAPLEPGPGGGNAPTATIERSLTGAFAILIAIVVVAASYITSEYRRGLIRTTLAASPSRGQVLTAKAAVAGVVAFVAGVVASVACVVVGVRREEAQGLFVLPVSVITEGRVIVGTGLLLGLMAVLAVCTGALLRRGGTAITLGIVVIVLPFLFAVIGVFPPTVAAWLLRLTPAAGFAIQQSIPNYPQIAALSTPGSGDYPLVPWAGFAVLLAWVAAAFVLALIQLRRRDA